MGRVPSEALGRPAGFYGTMVKPGLTAAVSVPDVAVRVYVAARLVRQLENVASPNLVPSGLLAQVSVAPAGVVNLSVTEAVLSTLLPLASWMATTGCMAQIWLTVPPDGGVTKINLLAAPGVTVKDELTALARVPDVAVRV